MQERRGSTEIQISHTILPLSWQPRDTSDEVRHVGRHEVLVSRKKVRRKKNVKGSSSADRMQYDARAEKATGTEELRDSLQEVQTCISTHSRTVRMYIWIQSCRVREWYSLHTNSLWFFLCPLQRLEDEAPDGVFTFYRRPNVRYYKVSLQRCLQGEERLIPVTTSTMLV